MGRDAPLQVDASVQRMREEYDGGGGRSGDNIREIMTAVRLHRVAPPRHTSPSHLPCMAGTASCSNRRVRCHHYLFTPPRHTYRVWQVRVHRVVLDPSVMVALMSMLVLEGWQNRLDPAVSVLQSIEQATSGGIFGTVSRLNDAVQDAVAAARRLVS
jgi:hypothetical protein